MVPYTLLGEDAPLAEAFAAKGLKFVTVLISIGAVAGLTTTLLVGLYVQVYVMPPSFLCITDQIHDYSSIKLIYLMSITTIVNSHVCILGLEGMGCYLQYLLKYTQQGILLCTLRSGLAVLQQSWQVSLTCTCSLIFFLLAPWYGNFYQYFQLHYLIGFTLTLLPFLEQTGYSVVSACVITLRWNDKATSRRSLGIMSIWQEGVLCLVIVAFCGFIVGLCYRYDYAIAFTVVAFLIAVAASFALQFRQV
jgi:hypothetical protein